ncbi:hypothetical protein [Pedobacter caeni]|uniref:Uncharacterized protein n=1 Tax=Pedobacter caeni TaxID=288992 RepID=A0A1M4UE18_9SPHI|nr:hypothetical protein [Pedobacter caeni]SHE55005.1 hypothetical protein SAMN04488522_101525 [Pedobacter caeni]
MKLDYLRKLLFAAIIITSIIVFTILQGYWVLWDYRTAPSSGCLDCDMFPDLLLSSLLPLLATGILHLTYYWLKPGLLCRTVFCVIMLILSWYAIDTAIFDEREASWSTYTHIWWIVLEMCILQTMAFGLIFGGIYYALHLHKNYD